MENMPTQQCPPKMPVQPGTNMMSCNMSMAIMDIHRMCHEMHHMMMEMHRCVMGMERKHRH